MSLLATAKANGLEPHAWFADTLTRLPSPKTATSPLCCRWHSLRSTSRCGRRALTVTRQFGYRKARLKGLFKNTAQILTLFAPSSL